MDLQDLIQQANILEYIRQYTEFEKKSNEYFAICPFPNHNEKTASFTVNEEKQLYYCFGCSSNRGGDILTFIEKYHNLSTRQAIHCLKQYLNLGDDIHITKPTEGLTDMRQMNKLMAMSGADEFKHKPLSIKYLNRFVKWNVSPWESEGISLDTINKYNILKDPFSSRIIIPIHDTDGHLINVSGRLYEDLPKPKYIYYEKMGKLHALWGYHIKKDIIKQKKEVILVEGVKSVLKLEEWGYTNAIALMTSHISDFQFKKIIELGVNVVTGLDKGVNVWKDANVLKLKRYCNVFNIYDNIGLLKEKDAPCDQGLKVWEKLYQQAKGVGV